jgi:hypothetical protein
MLASHGEKFSVIVVPSKELETDHPEPPSAPTANSAVVAVSASDTNAFGVVVPSVLRWIQLELKEFPLGRADMV